MGEKRTGGYIPEVTEIDRAAAFSAIVEGLLQHFADADVARIRLRRREAEKIAVDVLDRLLSTERPKDHGRN